MTYTLVILAPLAYLLIGLTAFRLLGLNWR